MSDGDAGADLLLPLPVGPSSRRRRRKSYRNAAGIARRRAVGALRGAPSMRSPSPIDGRRRRRRPRRPSTPSPPRTTTTRPTPRHRSDATPTVGSPSPISSPRLAAPAAGRPRHHHAAPEPEPAEPEPPHCPSTSRTTDTRPTRCRPPRNTPTRCPTWTPSASSRCIDDADVRADHRAAEKRRARPRPARPGRRCPQPTRPRRRPAAPTARAGGARAVACRPFGGCHHRGGGAGHDRRRLAMEHTKNHRLNTVSAWTHSREMWSSNTPPAVEATAR